MQYLLGLVNNKYVWILLAAIGLAGYFWYSGYHDKSVDVQEAQQKLVDAQRLQNVLIQQRDEAIQDKSQAAQIQIRTVIQKVNNDVIKLVKEPIYLNKCFDDSGLSDANTALTAGSSKPISEVPAPVPPK